MAKKNTLPIDAFILIATGVMWVISGLSYILSETHLAFRIARTASFALVLVGYICRLVFICRETVDEEVLSRRDKADSVGFSAITLALAMLLVLADVLSMESIFSVVPVISFSLAFGDIFAGVYRLVLEKWHRDEESFSVTAENSQPLKSVREKTSSGKKPEAETLTLETPAAETSS